MLNDKKTLVELAIKKEIEEANSKFPLFHSEHEGYAVLKEEIEETEKELEFINDYSKAFWNCIKNNNNDSTKILVDAIHEHSLKLVFEAIQVAAMCEKYKMSFFERVK